MSASSLQALNHYFGYQHFQGEQESIIDRILAGEELMVVMPTGAGKSICYQLPILMRPGYGMVISPLIALMHDQVYALRQRGIPAACINSNMNSQEQNQALCDWRAGRLKLLYIAPERFSLENFREEVQLNPPTMLAIDEAHCISQWGHDFRPAYHRIWEYQGLFEHSQICAYTATATPEVRDDIRQQLHKPDMQDVVSGFERPNLEFSVMQAYSKEDKKLALDGYLQNQVPTLIYVQSRKDAERLGKIYKIHFYHAGMSSEERHVVQEYFLTSPCPILAATNAFGMGIDRPDIRRVIHYGLPGSVEAYYQEAGRAGRDGQPAQCILLTSYADIKLQEHLLETNNPPPEAVVHLAQLLQNLAKGLPANTPQIISADYVAKQIHAFKGPSQAACGIKYLEHMGFFDKFYSHDPYPMITISLTQSAEDIAGLYATPATQREFVMAALARWMIKTQIDLLPTTLTQLSYLIPLPPSQIQRCLDALHEQGQLDYATEFGETTTYYLRPDILKKEAKSLVNVKSMQKKAQTDQYRFRKIREYSDTGACRQIFFCQYFGQSKRAKDACTICDNCKTKDAFKKAQSTHNVRNTVKKEKKQRQSTDNTAFYLLIAKAIYAMEFNCGFKRTADMLLGQESANGKVSLADNPYYGCLEKKTIGSVMKLLSEMVNLQLLEQAGDYSVLQLTAKGERFLEQNT